MPEMPKRPREHVLGDEAQQAFKNLLPPEWIYRSKSSDYGVDGEVELVLPNDEVTGRLFYVQLKGTDVEPLTQALKIRLKLSTVNYFRALDLPVLIVLYHAPMRRVYARWFQALDRSLPMEGQGTVSVRLSEEDLHTAASSASISRELEGIRALSLNKLRLPLGVALTSGLAEFTVAELVSAMKSLVSDDTVSFNPDAVVTVEISEEHTDISVGIAHKYDFPTKVLSSQGSPRVFAANICTAVGIVLGRAHQPHLGSVLILTSAQYGDLLASFPLGIEAAIYLAQDKRTAEALKIAQSAISSGDNLELAWAMTLVAISSRSPYSSGALHTEVLRSIVTESQRRADMTLFAAAQYNLANHLHSIGQRREALRYYHSALRSDKRYYERSYIWRELGVLLFESGHFHFAAVCYERAVAAGDSECRPFLADALMWTGAYGRALAEIDPYLKGIEYPPSEWVLKHCFLLMLRDIVGVGAQRREKALALQLADPRDGQFKESQFRAAIQADALCGLAWFNRAHSEVLAQNYSKGAEYYTAAALCQPNDLEAWCAAVVCALNSRCADLFGHVISAAYRARREDFSSAIFERVKQQPADYPKQQLIEALGEIITSVPKRRNPAFVRIFDTPPLRTSP